MKVIKRIAVNSKPANLVKKAFYGGLLFSLTFLQNCGQVNKPVQAEESPEPEYYTSDDFASVKKMDTHVHFNVIDSAFIEQSADDNFHLLDIVDDRPFGVPMDELEKIAIELVTNYPERISFATTFSVKTWGSKDWEEQTIAYLKNAISHGAIAVKIWKNIGMDLRDKNGKFVMVDDPRLDPVLDYLAKNNITVIGHNGEPQDCWKPLDKMTFSKGYYGAHPEYHMYLHPEYPSYEDQINARDHMLEKHPDLLFIGAHLGSLEWSLDELAKRLDKFPNMAVDLSRMSNLQLHTKNDWKKTRDFFIKYQDRLVYGTDRGVSPSKNPSESAQKVHDGRVRDWNYFVTDAETKSSAFEGAFKGLKLPRTVIDKIYLKNAQKWMPGMVKAK